jgi:cell division protein FtsA
MARRRIATGIDIGTHQTRVVVVEEMRTPTGTATKIIGSGSAPSGGVRHGYVVDVEDAATALRIAKRQAEGVARVKIETGFLAIGGVSLDEVRASGSAVVSRADQEITELDIEKVLEGARFVAESQFLNRRVLHEIPLQFRVDGAKSLGDPLGLRGNRIEGDYLFITCLAHHFDALTEVAEAADIDVIDHMASPLAGSNVTLTKDQKMKGCVLANVGAETLSIVVYDENIPVSVKVFPAGGSTITDELALGFRVSLEDAERIKTGRLAGTMYPKKKVDDIIASRFRTMFDLVDKHLKALGRRGTLPAGIILSGGGSGLGSVVEIAKSTLALPSRIADLLHIPADSKIRDASWAVAYGCALWALTGDTDTPKKSHFPAARKSLARFFRQFLP